MTPRPLLLKTWCNMSIEADFKFLRYHGYHLIPCIDLWIAPKFRYLDFSIQWFNLCFRVEVTF